MTAKTPIIIIGAGHAGVQVAASLREEGFRDPITLVGAERHLPYQRPPLSKAVAGEGVDVSLMPLRGPSWYDQHNIQLVLGVEVRALDRSAHTIELSDGRTFEWSRCILATGCTPRRLTVAGGDLEGVITLRTLDHAQDLRRIAEAKNVVIVGGGFIGLEVASIASSVGCSTTVLESAPRLMARAVSPIVSEYYAKIHRKRGVDVRLGVKVTELRGSSGHVAEVVIGSEVLPADLVIAGIGASPCDDLARASGLNCDDGILVDPRQQTSDPNIYAIGDCSAHYNPWAGRILRLESVQNAVDQAKVVARALCEKPACYDALPWFWSDQGDLKLQIAGMIEGADEFITLKSPDKGAFSICAFRQGQLIAVESINRPADHLAARRLLSAKCHVSPDLIRTSETDLKELYASLSRSRAEKFTLGEAGSVSP